MKSYRLNPRVLKPRLRIITPDARVELRHAIIGGGQGRESVKPAAFDWDPYLIMLLVGALVAIGFIAGMYAR